MAVLAVGASASSLQDVPKEPSVLQWNLQDVSASDAGRVQDAGNTMYKMRLSQKRKLDVTWTMLTVAEASWILKAFNPEYFYVRYFDYMDGGYNVRQFYRGDVAAPVKWINVMGGTRVAQITISLIER